MNIRILLAVIGIATAMVSGSLLAVGLRGVAVQLCLLLGFSAGFIAIGVEHFYRDSPMLYFTGHTTRVVVGCVCVTLGVGLLALVAGNLFTRGFH